jgi:hypothetical protein
MKNYYSLFSIAIIIKHLHTATAGNRLWPKYVLGLELAEPPDVQMTVESVKFSQTNQSKGSRNGTRESKASRRAGVKLTAKHIMTSYVDKPFSFFRKYDVQQIIPLLSLFRCNAVQRLNMHT